MRKSALVVKVCPKWASAWAGVNESIKTFNEGRLRRREARRRWRDGLPERGGGGSGSEHQSEGRILIWGFLPRESDPCQAPVLRSLSARLCASATLCSLCRRSAVITQMQGGWWFWWTLWLHESAAGCTVLCVDIQEMTHPVLCYTAHSSFVVTDEQRTFSTTKCSKL